MDYDLVDNEDALDILPHHRNIESVWALNKKQQAKGYYYGVSFLVGKEMGEKLMADVSTRVGLGPIGGEPTLMVAGVYLIDARSAWAAIDAAKGAEPEGG